MRIDVDWEAQAAYIQLRDVPYAFGVDLDHARRIDFGSDRQPVGVELLNITRPVNLEGLPERDAIAQLLGEQRIPVCTPALDRLGAGTSQ